MVKTASFTLRHLHPTTQRTLHRARKLYNQSFAVKTYPTLQPLITQALEDVLQDNFPLTYRKIFRCLNDHYLDLAAGNMKADRLWRTTPLRKHRSHFLDTACHLADEETGLSPDPHTYFPIVADLATNALDLFHNPEYFAPTQENNPYGAQYLDDNGYRIGTNAYNTKAFAWTLEGALELAKLTVFDTTFIAWYHPLSDLYLDFALAKACRSARYNPGKQQAIRNHAQACRILRAIKAYSNTHRLGDQP